MELKRVKVHAHDEPEFANIGTGTRRVLMWSVGDNVHIFNQPNFVHQKMGAERFKIFKPVEETLNAKATATALTTRRDFLKRSGYNFNDALVNGIIDVLSGSPDVTEEKLEEVADTETTGGKIMTPAELDAEAKGRTPTKARGKGQPSADEAPSNAPSPKDRVKLRSDKDDPPRLGTVNEVGPEQSGVRWDGAGQTSYEPNKYLVKVEEEAKPRLTKAEQAAKFNKSKESDVATKKAAATKKEAAPKKEKAAPKKEKAAKTLGKIKLLKQNWKNGEKNPRREGTKAAERCGEMIKYIAKHPSADASEVIANTAYRGDDLNYDIANKFIEVK